LRKKKKGKLPELRAKEEVQRFFFEKGLIL